MLKTDELKELRCPEHKFRLFAKIAVNKKIKVDAETNGIEVKCRECSKKYSKLQGREVEVFHYFDLAGNVFETKIKVK